MAKLLVSDKELIRNKFVQKAGKKLSDYLAKIGTQLQDRVDAILLDGIGMPKMFYNEYLDELKRFFEKDILEWSKKACEFKKLENETRNRVACALDHINTEKQLQDNFPEAYKILIEIKGKQKEENKCDSVENTRAFLSSLDK